MCLFDLSKDLFTLNLRRTCSFFSRNWSKNNSQNSKIIDYEAGNFKNFIKILDFNLL